MFLLISTKSFAQNSPVDSVVVKHCYVNDDGDFLHATYIDSFNVDGLIVSSTYIDSTNSISQIENFYYSSTNKITQHIRGFVGGSIYTQTTNETYLYDANDSLINHTILSVLYPSSSSRVLYSYSGSNSVITTTYQNIDSANWVDNQQIIDSLDNNHRVLREDKYSDNNGVNLAFEYTKWYNYLPNDSIDYYQESLNRNSYNDSLLFLYTYDSMSYLIKIESFRWNPASGAFSIPQEYWTRFYDSNHNLIATSTALAFDSVGAYWNLMDTAYFSYDSQQRLIASNFEYIPHDGSSTTYSFYAGTNNVDSINFCRWAQSSFYCSDCKQEYFSLIQGEQNVSKNYFIVFPNPASHQLQIIMPENSTEDLDVRIIDLESRIVLQNKIHKESYVASLSNIDLPNGIYFIRIQSGPNQFTQKLIVYN